MNCAYCGTALRRPYTFIHNGKEVSTHLKCATPLKAKAITWVHCDFEGCLNSPLQDTKFCLKHIDRNDPAFIKIAPFIQFELARQEAIESGEPRVAYLSK